MFAKATVFFALVAFVNAAPIVDYSTNPGVDVHLGNPVKSSPSDAVDYANDPGVDFRPPHTIKVNLPGGGDEVHPKRDISLNIAANPGVDIHPGIDIHPWHPIKVTGLPVALKRGLPLEISANPGVDVRPGIDIYPLEPIKALLPAALKRGHSVANDESMGVSDNWAGVNAEFVPSVNPSKNAEVSAGISKREDFNFGFSADSDLIFPGVNGDLPVFPRGFVTDPVLYQLQNLADNIAKLLHARDASDAANSFLTEVKGGNINVNDVLSTTNGILASLR